MVTDRAMAKKMPTHSRMSAWPPAMERVMLTPRVMAAAIISMISIGSAGVCPLAMVICSSRVWLTQRTETRVISLAYRAAWRFPPSWKNKTRRWAYAEAQANGGAFFSLCTPQADFIRYDCLGERAGCVRSIVPDSRSLRS